MKIESIIAINDGYVHCKSNFYSSHDCLSSDVSYNFSVGTNKLIGDIDSGVWAVSYLLSMYKYRDKDFVLFEQPQVTLNKTVVSLNEFSQHSCYMDSIYPLFSTKSSIKKLVLKGIRKNNLNFTPNDVKELFCLDTQRFEQPLSSVGNERFRAMAAIGYAYGKQVFCFPWLSQRRFEYYHRNITGLLNILEPLEKVVILPIGK